MERAETESCGPLPEVVCLGTVEWLVIHSVAEYTMLELSQTHRVLFVEPFRSWLARGRVAKLQARRHQARPRLEQVADRLWVYRPPAIGLPGTSRWMWPAAVNGWLLALLLRRVTRRLGFRRPVLWTYLYDSAAFLRRFGAALTIYECADHDEALARDDRQRRLIRRHEASTCRTADLVFAVTEELAAPRRAYNPETHEVNCAAATNFFGTALLAGTSVPPDIAGLPRPVLGYLGGVDPWKIDVPLLRGIAEARPDWTIALVGYVWFGFDAAAFAGCPNIHLLGAKAYADFPAYLKGMDVGLIPFPLNDITRNGDALKLYEYLAGGRPVVSRAVPAARRLSPPVRIADTAGEFIAAIEAALAEPPEAAAARAATVQPHSWAVRTRQKKALIATALARRGVPTGTG